MSNNNDMSAKITLSTSQAEAAAKTLAANLKALGTAGTTAGTKMTAAQRTAASAAVSAGTKIMEANAKIIASDQARSEAAVKAVRVEKTALADAANARSMARSTTSTNNANTTTVATSKADLNYASADAKTLVATETAGAIKLNALSKQNLTNAQLAGQVIRNNGAIEELEARKAQQIFKQNLDLRKQEFREQQALNRAQEQGTIGMSSMRYALYDVGRGSYR